MGASIRSGEQGVLEHSVSQRSYSSCDHPRASTRAPKVAHEHSVQMMSAARAGDNPGLRAPVASTNWLILRTALQPLRVLGVPEPRERGFGVCRGIEYPHQWPNPRPDAWLGVGVEGELATGVRLVDDRANRGSLLDGYVGTVAAARHRGKHRRFEQSGLAGGCAVDGLQGHTRLGRDRGDGRTRVAVL